jgi:hypothetical protein
LAWDVDPAGVDPDRHQRWLIGRVLSYGNLAQVYDLERRVGRSRIETFFRKGGLDLVDRQTAAFWLALLDIPENECKRRSSRKSNWKF